MDVAGIFNAVISDAMTTGLFEVVNGHEPKNKPGNGLTCSVWADEIRPLPNASGLKATSVYLVLNVRLTTSMLQQPYDDIDPNLVKAVDTLLGRYSAGFTLGGLIRNVDLLGSEGNGLSARAGYLDQDKTIFRAMVITLPMVINDVWSQTP